MKDGGVLPQLLDGLAQAAEAEERRRSDVRRSGADQATHSSKVPCWRLPVREPPGAAGYAVPRRGTSGARLAAAAHQGRTAEQQRAARGRRGPEVVAAGVRQGRGLDRLSGLPDVPALATDRRRGRRGAGVHLPGDIGRRPVTGRSVPRRLMSWRLLAGWLVTRGVVARGLVARGLLIARRLVTRGLVTGRLVARGLVTRGVVAARRLVTRGLMPGRLVARGLVTRGLLTAWRLVPRRLMPGRLVARGLVTGRLVARGLMTGRLVAGWAVVAAGVGAVVAEGGVEQPDDVDGVAAQVHRQMNGGLEQVAREYAGGGRGAARGPGVGVRARRRAGQYPGRRRGDQHAVFHKVVHVWSFIFSKMTNRAPGVDQAPVSRRGYRPALCFRESPRGR